MESGLAPSAAKTITKTNVIISVPQQGMDSLNTSKHFSKRVKFLSLASLLLGKGILPKTIKKVGT